MSWNARLHPRWPDGRFRPTVSGATFYAGKGGQFYGVKAGVTLRVPTRQSRVLVKGIAGYAPPKDSDLARTLQKLEKLDPKGTREQKGRTLEEAMAKFGAVKLNRIANTTSDQLVRKAAQRAATKQAARRPSGPKQTVGTPPKRGTPPTATAKAQARSAGTKATAASPPGTRTRANPAGRKVRR